MAISSSTSLAVHAAGLIVIYSGYSLYQEKIMKGSYGPDGARFTSSAILVLCNRLFSMLVGIAIIMFRASRHRGEREHSLRARLRPASPIFAYAAVAACNFVATFCQYEALRYVGFTTQALAKCCKMAPVLVVARIVYKKTHPSRHWVAASVVVFGCATYLSSRTGGAEAATSDERSASFWQGVAGTLLILGYLFFDGLTSTTQERVFGKTASSTDPFGPDSPVLDQMLWVNAFSILISVVASAATYATTLVPSVKLMVLDPTLALDVLGLSATAATGLIVLLNTIASFGALTSSTIMTVRQFLSILLNAGVFGNFSSVGPQGWTGVFWVAGGIFIKMDRRWDAPKPPKRPVVVTSANSSPDLNAGDEDSALLFAADEKREGGIALADSPSSSPIRERRSEKIELPPARKPSLIRQYGPPVLLPLVLGLALGAFTGDVQSSLASLPDYLPEVFRGTTAGLGEGPALIGGAIADEVDIDQATVEGSMWAQQLHDAVNPNCPDIPESVTYPRPLPRTALATFPRSGNSYIRSMVERSTGYRTSAMYCDRVLELAFHGECNKTDNFLVKTHYPSVRTFPHNDAKHWQQFDRVLHVVRNPLDAIYSYYAWRTHAHDHEHKEDVAHLLGTESVERSQATLLATRYRAHDEYWASVPLRTHELRYEDLRATPLPVLMDSLAFILPRDELPTLDRLACTVELNEQAQAYQSGKRNIFASWDMYTPELRQQVLQIVAPQWCRWGYQDMAEAAGLETGVDCKALKSAPHRMK